MKRTPLIFTTALFVIGSLAITGCGGSGENEAEEQEHNEAEEEDGHSHEHEDTHSGASHMDHMKEVREGLKTALGDDYDKAMPEATEEQLALGKETYTKICATCHGMSGKGDGPASAAFEQKPADFTDPGHSKYYSDQGRIYIIKNGVKDTPMVGWQSTLDENEIHSVYAYVRSLRKEVAGEDHDHGDGMYTCSMHPEVSGNKGGECPKCGMTLVLREHDDGVEDDGHDDHDHEH